MSMETNSGKKTQSFMLSPEEIKVIDETKETFGFTTKSEALRQLVQDALIYRSLKQGVEDKVLRKMQLEIAEGVTKALARQFGDSPSQ